MLGLDVYNGNQAQLSGFRNRARVTFPLLKRAAGGMRTFRLGDLVVADRQGIVRYLGKIEVSANRQRAQETVTLLLNEKPVVAPITQPLTFEQLYLGDTATQQLRISNTGNATLEITSLQADIPKLTAALPITVPAGESRSIDFTFMPDQTGSFAGIIRLITNTDPIEITLTPISVQPPPAPALEIPQSTIDFGTFDQNTTAQHTLIIKNTGTGPLTVSNIQSDITGLTISTTQVTLEPDNAATVTLSLSLDTPGPFSGTLDIFSDDPGKPTFTISISGEFQIVASHLSPDFNTDGKVDFTDFLSFAAAFGSSNPDFDLDQSGKVDFPDFLIFARSFGNIIN